MTPRITGQIVVLVLGIAAVAGFALGTWLGHIDRAQTTNQAAELAAAPSSLLSVTPKPSAPVRRLGTEGMRVSGSGDSVTESFEVARGWRVDWETTGTAFALAVTGGPNLGRLVTHKGPATGSTSIPVGGTFRVDIEAEGPWSITLSPAPAGSAAVSGNSATPEVIFSIEGTKHEVTDSFEAKPGWQIQWEIEGDQIAVAASGDPNLGVVVDQKGPASGVTGIAQGGTFALDIVATGPWKITVIEGEDPAAS